MATDDAPASWGEWVHGLSATRLACRDYGHAWRPLRVELDGELYTRSQRCTRCRTERSQRITLGGRILGGHYDYPDGYLAPKGTGRLSSADRAELRLESIARSI